MQLFPQPGHEKIPNRMQYYHELATRLSQMPGVESVSYLHMGPASGYESRRLCQLALGARLRMPSRNGRDPASSL